MRKGQFSEHDEMGAKLLRRTETMAFYAQDQWTMRKLTLTYGIRYEYLSGYVPPQHRVPVRRERLA